MPKIESRSVFRPLLKGVFIEHARRGTLSVADSMHTRMRDIGDFESQVLVWYFPDWEIRVRMVAEEAQLEVWKFG